MLRIIKPVLQQIRLFTGLNTGGKTPNIAIQLVLQHCCKSHVFVARFSVPSEIWKIFACGIRNPVKHWNPESWVLES